jgi:hypothetical protein
MTPDPYTNSGRLTDPGSWNRYAYTRGDPVSRADPMGTTDCDANGDNCSDSVTVDGGAPDDLFPDADEVSGPLNMIYVGSATQTRIAQAQAQAKGQAKRAQRVLNLLPGVVGLAEKALDNPNCDNIFGVGVGPDGSTIDAGLLLFDLFNSIGGFGSIGAMDLPSAPGTIVEAETDDVGVVDNGPYTHDVVDIFLNDLNGTNFGGSNTQAQVGTLLHELGHAMNFVFGPSTNNFDQTDSGNPGKSSWNDLLIANCLK